MEIKLIIVSPKYQMNVGYMARIAKNFGIKKLHMVSPRADIRGKKAVMFSKHAVDLLKGAKVYKSLEDATRDCDVVAGTSGILRENARFTAIEPDAAARKIGKEYRKAVVGLVIGRDDSGLNFEELSKCDILVHIGANDQYPVLNISHALAILLYSFTKGTFKHEGVRPEKPRPEELAALSKTFDQMIKNKRIRSREDVRNVFHKMLRRSQLTRHEVHALITAFK
jgi:tRNA/rRNA methyltransferase